MTAPGMTDVELAFILNFTEQTFTELASTPTDDRIHSSKDRNLLIPNENDINCIQK